MPNTYRNAGLTLCATRSPDSDSGCYAVAPTEHLSQHWSFTGPNNYAYELYSRTSLNHMPFISRALPLLTRGWGLQERLLCPRIVHFAKEELVWECLERFTCECSQIKAEMLYRGIKKQEVQPRVWLHQSLSQMARCWHGIVRSYAELNLTFDTDIFPALQGLANIMPSRMGKYLAGLWSETLISDLCWHVRYESWRPGEWRAPTWSWASTTGEVDWQADFFERETVSRNRFVIIVDAVTTTKGNDATGELTSGILLLRGHGLTGTILHPRTQQPTRLQGLHIHYGASLSINSNTSPAIFESRNGAYDCGQCGVFWDSNLTIPGPFFVADGSQALVVKLEDWFCQAWEPYRTSWLVLIPSKHDATAYERIGLLVDNGSLNGAYENSAKMNIKII
jgi:hypothetical protein